MHWLPSNPKRRAHALRRLFALILTFTGSACGDETSTDRGAESSPFVCDGSLEAPLRGEVDASAFMLEASGVASYRYAVSRTGDVVELDARDSGRAPVAIVRLESRAEPAAIHGYLDVDGVERARVEIVEGTSSGDYEVQATYATDQGVLRVATTYGVPGCGAPTPVEDQPPCLGAVDVRSPWFALPGCGPSRSTTATNANVPTRITYAFGDPSGASSLGGSQRDGTMWATLRVMADGRSRADDEIATWARETGADRVLGAEAVRRLAQVLADAPWQRTPQDHFDHCAIDQGTARSALCGEAASELGLLLPGVMLLGDRLALCNEGFPSLPGSDPNGFHFECKGESCRARAFGDPHFVTFDGLAYDFQGVGDFVVAATNDDSFEVHARFAAPPGVRADLEMCRHVSITTDLAFELGASRVHVDAAGALRLDGGVVAPGEEPTLDGGHRLHRDADGAVVASWPNGRLLRALPRSDGIQIQLAHGDGDLGRLGGLLGHFDGDVAADLVSRDGDVVSLPPSTGDLYERFGRSWAVPAEASLLPSPREEPPSFPAAFAVVDAPDTEIAEADRACREGGVTGSAALDACVLDAICLDTHALVGGARGIVAAAQLAGDVALVGDARLILGERRGALDAAACGTPVTASVLPEARGFDVVDELTTDRPGAAVQPGSRVASYVVELPPHATSIEEGRVVEGVLRFPGKILGLQLRAESLATGSLPLGGLAGLGERDEVEVRPDGRSARFSLAAAEAAPSFRILVEENAR